MERDADESCAAYHARGQMLSIRVLRILRAGGTAALDGRSWPRGGYPTFVLETGGRLAGRRDRAGRPAEIA